MFAKNVLRVSIALLILISAVVFAEDTKPGAGKEPAKEEKKEGEKVQCSELTKSGERCKRMTKNANGKCWQHGGNKEEAAEEAKEEPKKEEVKKEEPKKEKAPEVKKEEAKEEPKKEETKKGSAKKEKAPEVKKEEVKEEPKKEEVKKEDVKKEEGKEDPAAESKQCTELTKAGERCKKMTKSPNGKCKQHGGN